MSHFHSPRTAACFTPVPTHTVSHIRRVRMNWHRDWWPRHVCYRGIRPWSITNGRDSSNQRIWIRVWDRRIPRHVQRRFSIALGSRRHDGLIMWVIRHAFWFRKVKDGKSDKKEQCFENRKHNRGKRVIMMSLTALPVVGIPVPICRGHNSVFFS